jgi:drug/metabolite transporter (DMT)-like permease
VDQFYLGTLFAFAAMLMYASNILVTKVASARLDVTAGFVISVGVNLLFGALVFIVELVMRDEPFRWRWVGVAWFALAGASATYFGRWFFFGAIARLGAAKASLFHVSSPAFTAIIAWLALDERLGLVTWIGIAATVVGLFLVSVPPGALRAPAQSTTTVAMPSAHARLKRLLASGFAVGIGATFAYSVGNVLRGAAVRDWNEPIAGAMLGALAAFLLHVVVGADHAGLVRRIRIADRSGVRLYAFGGVLTITAQMCTVASMRYIPVAVATVITMCTPLVVIPASYWLLKNRERLGAATLIGAAITMGGVLAILSR